MIGFQKRFDVNGRTALTPERFANGEDARTFDFAAGDAAADEIGVFEDRGDVEDGSEAPAGEHFFELRSELLGREFFGVEQTRGQDVDVAVPEARRDNEAFAVDYRGAGRDFKGGGRNRPLEFDRHG